MSHPFRLLIVFIFLFVGILWFKKVSTTSESLPEIEAPKEGLTTKESKKTSTPVSIEGSALNESSSQNSSTPNLESSAPTLESLEKLTNKNPKVFRPKDLKEFIWPTKNFPPLASIFKGNRRSCLKNKNEWFVIPGDKSEYGFWVNEEGILKILSRVLNPRSHLEVNRCLHEFETNSSLIFEAEVKNSDINGYANLHARAQDQYGAWIENQKKSLGRQEKDWRKVSVEIFVPEETKALVFGVTLEGEGTVEVRNIGLKHSSNGSEL